MISLVSLLLLPVIFFSFFGVLSFLAYFLSSRFQDQHSR